LFCLSLNHQGGRTVKNFAKLVAAAAIATVWLPAYSQTQSTPRIDKRQANQAARIEKGEQSGALNQKEAARLEKGQARVQKMEDKAVADGKVTAKERERIEHAQNKQSRRIYNEKHDKQTAN
jgi:uncharacterized membrane protein YebE (DUF533 family)